MAALLSSPSVLLAQVLLALVTEDRDDVLELGVRDPRAPGGHDVGARARPDEPAVVAREETPAGERVLAGDMDDLVDEVAVRGAGAASAGAVGGRAVAARGLSSLA